MTEKVRSNKWLSAIPLLGVALVVALLLAVAVVSTPASTSTANLKAAHVGATSLDFQSEADERCDGQWGWHFVMPNKDTSFVSLTATFSGAGPVNATAFFSAGPQTNKHAYVFTPGSVALFSGRYHNRRYSEYNTQLERI